MFLKAMKRRLRKHPKQHVLPHPDGWALKPPAGRKAVHTDKRTALRTAIEAAKQQGAMLIIHGNDGRVQETRNYA